MQPHSVPLLPSSLMASPSLFYSLPSLPPSPASPPAQPRGIPHGGPGHLRRPKASPSPLAHPAAASLGPGARRGLGASQRPCPPVALPHRTPVPWLRAPLGPSYPRAVPGVRAVRVCTGAIGCRPGPIRPRAGGEGAAPLPSPRHPMVNQSCDLSRLLSVSRRGTERTVPPAPDRPRGLRGPRSQWERRPARGGQSGERAGPERRLKRMAAGCVSAPARSSPEPRAAAAMARDPPPEDGAVSVVVRVRPPAPCEREGPRTLHVLDQHILIFNPDEAPGTPGGAAPARGLRQQGKDQTFVFDRVFGEGASQEEVFQHTTRGLLDSVLGGYNCSVFAYGATGAGKTHTMLGSESSPGIMYRTMAELYSRIEARREEKSCEVLVSYQEVYNEQIHDLLEPKGPLAIWEDPEKGVVVQGLSFHQPTSAEQLLEMLANGNKNRTQHPTDANASSSRSHAICQIHVRQQDRVGGLTRELQVAKMSLIDLAGSERASATQAKGERLREGANINRSLLALVNVINALADAKGRKSHVPYRDSKLTRLLKDSIGGNCRTVMIAAVSPAAPARDDTYNTLRYASRAKDIRLSLKSNVLSFDYHISKYPMICEQLKAEVADLRAKLRAYEDAAREAQNPPQSPLSSSPTGLPRLVTAILKVAQKQYSLLRAANLLTPELVAEFGELERRVQREAGASPVPGLPRGSAAKASLAVPSAPLQPLAPLPSPTPVAASLKRKRRKAELSPSARGLGAQKQLQRCGGAAGGPEAAPGRGSPAPTGAAQPPFASPAPRCCTPKMCPLTVVKGRVPLAPLPAQNRCGPVQDLNATFEVCADGGSSAQPPACDRPHSPLLTKADGLPLASQAPVSKRRRVERASAPVLPSSSSRRRPRPSRIPEHLPGKGSKRSTPALAGAPPTQPMKLFC
ncbi:kinesin-like protein KIF18B isoform X1 [Colius striatus]|uniref:kinesin-like protein KIF18B isoform X1 n=1 Tax=Colius striatus TaxID=57412 RepID=UPI002B1D1F48|nr:kinesin-like protein KIF18B isoform X1 [Colius striatus]